MAQKASLPSKGYEPPDQLILVEGLPVVRFFPEHGNRFYNFQFVKLGLPSMITKELANGFSRAVGPAGTRRTYASAKSVFSGLLGFARSLRESSPVPASLNQLTAAHLHQVKLTSTSSSEYTKQVSMLRLVMRGSEDLSSSFRDALYTPLSARKPASPVGAYSNAEVAMIRRSARKTIRGALFRIRAARCAAANYLASNPTPTDNQVIKDDNLRERLLAHVVTYGGLPRHQDGSLKVDGSGSLIAELNPTQEEVWALAVLLMCLTGLNLSTVIELTADHTVSSATGNIPVVLLRGVKARRGPWNSELDLSFIGKSRGSATDDFATPYGVYQVALELGKDMRRHTGNSALFMVFTSKRRTQTPSGFGYKPLTSYWGTPLKGFTDVHGAPQVIDARRIRRWFLDQHQRPVAQSVRSLVSSYLAKDPTTLSSYQGVVEEALDEEFQRIRLENTRRVLTTADRAEAAHDPSAVASRFGIDPGTLSELLAGELDTATSACVDNKASPYSRNGEPCTASFLMCLGCPCSRSEPRHLPIQAFTLLALRELRPQTDDHEWQSKFYVPTARLEDLIELQEADLSVEASRATEEDARVVRALIEGDLDL